MLSLFCFEGYQNLFLKIGTNFVRPSTTIFSLSIECTGSFKTPSCPPSHPKLGVNWFKATEMNIDHYQRTIIKKLLTFDCPIPECLSLNCSHHQNVLDWYAQHLLSVLLSSAYACIPLSSKSSHHKLVGWSKRCSDLKMTSIFWYKVLCEAGCPPSGVLCQIRKKAKSRYKYETRRLKRKQQSINWQKFASSLSRKDYGHFWSTLKNLNSPKSRRRVPTIDGVSGDNNIANLMTSKVEKILNTHSFKSCADLHSLYNSSLSSSQLKYFCVK